MLSDREKWWPKGVKRTFIDPLTGTAAEQILMQFYNEPAIWRCTVCGWNEVFGLYDLPRCRKCKSEMRPSPPMPSTHDAGEVIT